MEKITSNCQQLESLKLTEFCGFHRLHLTSSKCKRQELIEYRYSPDCIEAGCHYFEVVAPYVQHLKIQVVFDGVKIMLSDLSSLVHADLTYNLYNFYESDEVIGKSMVKDHLTSVACANELIIPSLYIEWSPLTFDTTTEQTELMKYLLEHAKNLVKLVIVPANHGCSKMIESLLALPRVSNTTLLVSVEPVADVEYE
ncbi:hypothetical protein MTR67_001337 [Solanum verrucosum]|uniref:FBD domain-containing protein n=1 Tax=Solanum verrucosum TaxID=315347 RepID=A0AAF0PP43_SOLVR|nr:hypothetical protein MTR67_001337 [Solanum verrucosum]